MDPERRTRGVGGQRDVGERRAHRVGVGRPREGELLAAPARHDQEIGAGLGQVVEGDRRERRRITDLDHRLELRQVRDQRGDAREIIELCAPLIVDQGRGLGEVALQFGFGLRRQPRADEIHRRPD